MKNEREIVFDILNQKNYSNLELQKVSHHPQRAFITRLVYTIYQHYESLKYQFESLLHTKVPSEVELILVMAAAQKFKMDSIADYAIVNESVNLCKKVNRKYANLTNAVLKKLVNQEFKLSQSEDKLVDLSINTSHPLWMVRLLKAQYGLETTESLLYHHNTQPPLDLRFNPLKINESTLLNEYPVSIVDGKLVAESSIFKTNALNDGLVLFQDRNSQALINDLNFKKDEVVLDACCAPGTKLTQIALNPNVKEGIGVDLHQHRIELTQQLVDRWELTNTQLLVSDVLDYHPELMFDSILCDVPCSGLGVMRRKPDIKRRINPEDLDNLQKIQKEILEHCSSLLKSGGQLIYATCTLNKKENEKQIEQFLSAHPEFNLIKQETLLGPLNNGDSFFVAQLIKD